jgi:hypothetical protein
MLHTTDSNLTVYGTNSVEVVVVVVDDDDDDCRYNVHYIIQSTLEMEYFCYESIICD